MPKYFFSYLTKIASLESTSFSVKAQPKGNWQTGDYVACEVLPLPGTNSPIELVTGRMVEVSGGDYVVGALGKRCATLQAVGTWEAIGDDLRADALTAAGVIGRCTSKSSFMPSLLQMKYRGHILTGEHPLNMRDCVERKTLSCSLPLILIIGTSMDSGKTMSAKVIIRLLKARNFRVAGVKFTGVGRYKDILGMSDAGADCIFDFVDAGLPSTCCEQDKYEGVVEHILSCIAAENVDVIVGEAGASPLEPYNGESAVEKLKGNIACTVLCASDPYAVLGVMKAFATQPDLVAGRATCTTAGKQLVERFCRIKALDLTNPASFPELGEILDQSINKHTQNE